MKILSVVETLAHGGAESVLVDLVMGLTEHEHRVLHFSAVNHTAADKSFLETFRRAEVRCDDIHWGRFWDALAEEKILGAFRPDVVFFHWWGNNPLLPWIEYRRDEPIGRRPAFICVLHHHGITAPAGYDRYVLVAKSQLDQVAHIHPDRIFIIPNGIDLRRFPRRRRRPPGNEMVVGRLSNLREVKIRRDWPETLAAFELPQTRFVIAGGGELRAVLQRSAMAAGIEEKICFPGYVPRAAVPSMLAGFDVFCYSTSTAVECHPLALLEALAAGLPIVAEGRGGIPEIVSHGVNGLLCNSADEMGKHLIGFAAMTNCAAASRAARWRPRNGSRSIGNWIRTSNCWPASGANASEVRRG